MFDLSKIFDLGKKLALPDIVLKSKNYCTIEDLLSRNCVIWGRNIGTAFRALLIYTIKSSFSSDYRISSYSFLP
jgi:hypothetical protein